MSIKNDENKSILKPYFNPLGTWAFSIGTAIGWGSFVVTCNTYLSQAGILGTISGLLLGMAVVLVITHNLCYMIEREPDAGGIYTYGRKVRGYDTGFLVAWFLLLTYLAVLWANITSLQLFARRFLGSIFQFGYCYTVFGYDVYLGEALLSIVSISAVGWLCCRSKKIPQLLMIIMAVFFVGSLSVCAVVAMFRHGSSFSYEPLYLPDKSAFDQIIRITVISPWAFIGFENVAHFSEEFNYPMRDVRKVMLGSVTLTTLVYILMTVLSVTAYPTEYSNWISYIADMNNLSGIKAFPAFYAAYHYMGDTGTTILMLALLCVILTSIIGNLTTISRLLYALGRDRIWSEKLGEINSYGNPGNAIMLTVIGSFFIPFLGRTAIGWIVDVTTLGATVIYGFLSYFVWFDAREHNDNLEKITGMLGTVLMIIFVIMLLAPKILNYEAMASESYLLFTTWAILGLLVFRAVLVRDKENRFGRSIIVWIALLMLMLLTTMMWANRMSQQINEETMIAVEEHYQQLFDENKKPGLESEIFLKERLDKIELVNSRSTMLSYLMVIVAAVIMFNNLRIAQRREESYQKELVVAKQFGMTDALTGVKNKNAFTQWEERFDAEISSGIREPFAIAVCDINNLKKINDEKGHAAGDECIRKASNTICRAFKKSPVFRYGGDEFVVILQGEDYNNRLQMIAEFNKIEEDKIRNGESGIAVGMAEFNSDEHSKLLRVLEIADHRMYECKKHLKNLDA